MKHILNYLMNLKVWIMFINGIKTIWQKLISLYNNHSNILRNPFEGAYFRDTYTHMHTHTLAIEYIWMNHYFTKFSIQHMF